MDKIPDGSVDMIFTDLPYGTTRAKWDVVIPLEELWQQYKRVIKENGAILLTASQPFTTTLISSNKKMFRYEWVWLKNRGSDFLNANRKPLKAHEDVCVFYKKLPTYNPQKTQGRPYRKTGNKQSSLYGRVKNSNYVSVNRGGEMSAYLSKVRYGNRATPNAKAGRPCLLHD